MQERPYQVCSVSVMDTIADPDITFDEQGRSSYYHQYHERASSRLFNTPEHADKLEKIISSIKASGKGKDYDCIIGISGGVDSTYVAWKAKQMGLRPLAIHFDNGWNSELAVSNIEKTLRALDIDLFTYVINWEEFRSLQLAFLKASTPDGEIPTDHAIFALFFKIAAEKGIKYILNGNNFATESVMPLTWSYGHIDFKYISAVNKQFGATNLKEYPYLTPLKYGWYTFAKGIRIISILNYLNYQKDEAMEIIQRELGWKYYGGKHYESVYTRFYQGYVLPHKFKIDKRKAHLSTLIFSGQITREQALQELRKPAYPEGMLEQDYNFVLKKFNLTRDAFEAVMKQEPRTFFDYPNNFNMLNKMRKVLNSLRAKKVMYS